MSTGRFLPYGRHSISDDDVQAVVKALKSGWLTTGPLVQKFETALVETLGPRYAVTCSNGTAALHLAALALGLGPGDTAIVPAVTFLATANAMRFVGAEVIFADVDPETGLMRPEDLRRALAAGGGRRIRAVFPVHLNGQVVDMPAVASLARDNGLNIVEDACHAIATSVGSAKQMVGACQHSDMAAFSFHAVKTVAMGEGGAVTTNDPELHRRLTALRSHGMIREPERFERTEQAFDADGNANPWYYEMQEIGYNYRLTDLQCALGLSQLSRLDQLVARRSELVARYDALFAKFNSSIVRPIARVPGVRASWHLYVVLIDFEAAGIGRAAVMRALHALGIGTQVHYLPLHRQPYYRKRYGEMSLPGSEAYYAKALSLPLFPDMHDDDPERVVLALRKVLGI